MRTNKQNNKKILIVIVVCVVLLIVLGLKLLTNFTSDNDAIYGDRLEGIESNKITSSKKSEIKNNVESLNKTKSVKVSTQGKIINVEITLNDDVTRDDAKSLADKVIEKLSENEKKFYDVQVFISKTTDDASFPIIGYCHHNRSGFTWTLDR